MLTSWVTQSHCVSSPGARDECRTVPDGCRPLNQAGLKPLLRFIWRSRISDMTLYFQDGGHDVISRKASSPPAACDVIGSRGMRYSTW